MASRLGNSAHGILWPLAMDADAAQALVRPGMDPTRCFLGAAIWPAPSGRGGSTPDRKDRAAGRQPQRGMAAGAGVRARSYHASPGEMTSVGAVHKGCR
jgi:hypothetical protein